MDAYKFFLAEINGTQLRIRREWIVSMVKFVWLKTDSIRKETHRKQLSMMREVIWISRSNTGNLSSCLTSILSSSIHNLENITKRIRKLKT